MEEWLSDIEEEDPGAEGVGVEISGNAWEELAQTLHDRDDDFEYGSNADASRRTGFDQSVGNSTHVSYNMA